MNIYIIYIYVCMYVGVTVLVAEVLTSPKR